MALTARQRNAAALARARSGAAAALLAAQGVRPADAPAKGGGRPLTGGRGSFSPYQPPDSPPAGYYDPNIDSQVGAAQRGLGDTTEDAATAGRRDTSDYLLGEQELQRRASRGGNDLTRQINSSRTSFDRAESDQHQRGVRANEDYTTSIAALTRNYSRLAGSQAQRQRAAGLTGGSAALQAAAQRAQNEGTDRAPIDRGFDRFKEDFGRAAGRLREDRSSAETGFATARGRLGEDTSFAQGRLELNGAPPSAQNPLGGRRFQDRNTQLSRAGREYEQFTIDAGRQKFQEAAGNGYTLPERGEPGGQPVNEFSDAAGAYQTRQVGGISRRVNPDGSVRALSPRDEEAARRRAAQKGSASALMAAQRAARRRR